MNCVKIIKVDNLAIMDIEINKFVINKKIKSVNLVPFVDYGNLYPTYVATILYEVE